jgi:hypothetical protein
VRGDASADCTCERRIVGVVGIYAKGRRQSNKEQHVQDGDSPGNGTQVTKGDSDEKREASANQASNSGRTGVDGGHATHLKVQSGKVTKAENEDGGPVPKNCVGKGCKGLGIEHLVAKDALVSKRVGTIVNQRTRGSVGGVGAVLAGIVATGVGDIFTSDSIVEVAHFLVGVNISGESNGRLRRVLFGVGNEPVAANDTARPVRLQEIDRVASLCERQESASVWCAYVCQRVDKDCMHVRTIPRLPARHPCRQRKTNRP